MVLCNNNVFQNKTPASTRMGTINGFDLSHKITVLTYTVDNVRKATLQAWQCASLKKTFLSPERQENCQIQNLTLLSDSQIQNQYKYTNHKKIQKYSQS